MALPAVRIRVFCTSRTEKAERERQARSKKWAGSLYWACDSYWKQANASRDAAHRDVREAYHQREHQLQTVPYSQCLLTRNGRNAGKPP
jgi:hypothetical protein